MARQPSVGWACGWLVPAVFWSWVETCSDFPDRFWNEKLNARAHSVRAHLQHFRSQRSYCAHAPSSVAKSSLSQLNMWSWNCLLNAGLILYWTSRHWSIIIGTRLPHGKIQPPLPPVIDLDGHTRSSADKIIYHRNGLEDVSILSSGLSTNALPGELKSTWRTKVVRRLCSLRNISERSFETVASFCMSLLACPFGLSSIWFWVLFLNGGGGGGVYLILGIVSERGGGGGGQFQSSGVCVFKCYCSLLHFQV